MPLCLSRLLFSSLSAFSQVPFIYVSPGVSFGTCAKSNTELGAIRLALNSNPVHQKNVKCNMNIECFSYPKVV